MNTPNIEILRCTEVIRMNGDGHLSSVEILNKTTGEKENTGNSCSFQLHRRDPAD